MKTKVSDCIVAIGKYKDFNGQEKVKWENVGAELQDTDANGKTRRCIMLKKTFNPAGVNTLEGADSICIFLQEPKQQTGFNNY